MPFPVSPTDFSPLKVVRDWKDAVVQKAEENIVIEEVDAHNIVPTWAASNQAEVRNVKINDGG